MPKQTTDSAQRRHRALLASISKEFTPATGILTVAAIALSVWSVVHVLDDPYSDSIVAWLGFIAFTAFGAWLVVELLWHRPRSNPLRSMYLRLVYIGGATVLLALLLHAVLAWNPAGPSAERYPEVHSPTQFGTYAAAVGLTFVMDIAMLLIGVIIGVVGIFIPFIAVFQPRRFAGVNAWPTDVDDRELRKGTIPFAAMLFSTFAAPAGIVYGIEESGADNPIEAAQRIVETLRYPQYLFDVFPEIMWLVGIAFAGIGVWAVFHVLFWQRRRNVSPQRAWPNPAEPDADDQQTSG